MDFGNRLRYIREFRGFTQKQLGLAIGLSEKSAESTISQYERCEKMPRKQAIEKLTLALNVPKTALIPISTEFSEGILQTLLFDEDSHYLKPCKFDDNYFIGTENNDINFYTDLECWYEAYNNLKSGIWTKEQYIEWKLNYPYIKPSSDFDCIKSDLIKSGFNIDDNETSLWKYVLLNRNKNKNN